MKNIQNIRDWNKHKQENNINLGALVVLAKAIMKKTKWPYAHYKNNDMLRSLGVDYLSDYQITILFNNAKNAKIKLEIEPYYDWEYLMYEKGW